MGAYGLGGPDALSGVELRQLRAFAVVAEAGTVTEAARRLRVAQPSLSQQIAGLERRVGATLFHRGPRGVELTESGRALLSGAQRAFAELEAALTAARGTAPPVRIGLCHGVPDRTLDLVEELVAGARPAEPGYEQLTTAEQEARLRAGELALGVLRLPVAEAGLRLRTLGEFPLGVVLDRAHPLAGRSALDWPQLAGQRLLWFPAARAPGYAAALLGHLAERGWTPELTVPENAGHTLFRRALRGRRDLVALRPRHTAEDDPLLTWRPLPDPFHETLALAALADGPWARLLGG
ncbi:LysR family transcriptional regulator [Streptomyces palmae]|uniref:LysR family transcriptional regulator n=1 Tax=Streptomyces palmae TaxID=1701085 RepID=UPI001FD7AEE6|nr:LysR family transcriptional regulator [Streptomyces palmae]